MKKYLCRVSAAAAVCVLFTAILYGCSQSETPGFTRIHLENDSESALTFLAIEDSEVAASTADNRLTKPLPPQTVFSAVLSRPGNYWVRTETEEEGTIVRRIEGPLRLGQGVLDWEYTPEDEAPLYHSVPPGSSIAVAATPTR